MRRYLLSEITALLKAPKPRKEHVNLQHTAAALFAAFQLDFAQFVIGDVLHVAHQHQGAGDFFYGSVDVYKRQLYHGHFLRRSSVLQ